MLGEYIKEKYNIDNDNKFDIIISPNIENVSIWNKNTKKYDLICSYEDFMRDYNLYWNEKIIESRRKQLNVLKKECRDSLKFFLTL